MGGAHCIYQGEQKCTQSFGGNLKETDYMKELGSGLNKMGVWTGPVWFRIRTGVGCCQLGNETVGSIEQREFVNQLSSC
jgi:hypothetical protein